MGIRNGSHTQIFDRFGMQSAEEIDAVSPLGFGQLRGKNGITGRVLFAQFVDLSGIHGVPDASERWPWASLHLGAKHDRTILVGRSKGRGHDPSHVFPGLLARSTTEGCDNQGGATGYGRHPQGIDSLTPLFSNGIDIPCHDRSHASIGSWNNLDGKTSPQQPACFFRLMDSSRVRSLYINVGIL